MRRIYGTLFAFLYFLNLTEGANTAAPESYFHPRAIFSYPVRGSLDSNEPRSEFFEPPLFVENTIISVKFLLIGPVSAVTVDDATLNAVLMDEEYRMLATVTATYGGGTQFSVVCPHHEHAVNSMYHIIITGQPDFEFELHVRFILAEVQVSDKAKKRCDSLTYCPAEFELCRKDETCSQILEGECDILSDRSVSLDCWNLDCPDDDTALSGDCQSKRYFDILVSCVQRCWNHDGVYISDAVASNEHIYISYFDVTKEDAEKYPLEIRIALPEEERVALDKHEKSNFTAWMLVGNTENGCPTLSDLYQDSVVNSRLTWKTQGSLHFSKTSTPPLSKGRWFIGLYTNSPMKRDYQLTVFRTYYADDTSLHFFGSIGIPFIVGFCFVFATVLIHRDTDENRMSVKEKFSGVVHHWYCGKTKYPHSYAWWTFLLVTAFGVATIQVVLSKRSLQEQSGDNDTCYFNELCFVPVTNWHVPSNNLESNAGYIIMGHAFIVQTAVYQVSYFKGIFQYGYSTYYALGIALAAEGYYSLTYHICPTIETFQFDTTNMFIIAALLMVAVYQQGEETRNFDEKGDHEDEYTFHFIRAPKFFVFMLIPLLTFNYIGTDLDSFNSVRFNRPAFAFSVCVWEALLFFYFWYRTRYNTKLEKGVRGKGRLRRFLTLRENGFLSGCCGGWVVYLMFSLFVIGFTGYELLTGNVETAKLFTLLLVSISLVYLIRGGLVNIIPKKSFYIIVFCYLTAAIVLFGQAVSYFSTGSSDKSILPEDSRSINKPCDESIGWDFFDLHDLWHIFGSYGLYLFMQAVFWINPPPTDHIEARIVSRGQSARVAHGVEMLTVRAKNARRNIRSLTKSKKHDDDFLDSDVEDEPGDGENKEDKPVLDESSEDESLDEPEQEPYSNSTNISESNGSQPKAEAQAKVTDSPPRTMHNDRSGNLEVSV